MISFPSISGLFASSTGEAATLLTQFLPLLVLALTVVIGVRAFKYLRRKITGAVASVTKLGGRRMRRGRR